MIEKKTHKPEIIHSKTFNNRIEALKKKNADKQAESKKTNVERTLNLKNLLDQIIMNLDPAKADSSADSFFTELFARLAESRLTTQKPQFKLNRQKDPMTGIVPQALIAIFVKGEDTVALFTKIKNSNVLEKFVNVFMLSRDISMQNRETVLGMFFDNPKIPGYVKEEFIFTALKSTEIPDDVKEKIIDLVFVAEEPKTQDKNSEQSDQNEVQFNSSIDKTKILTYIKNINKEVSSETKAKLHYKLFTTELITGELSVLLSLSLFYRSLADSTLHNALQTVDPKIRKSLMELEDTSALEKKLKDYCEISLGTIEAIFAQHKNLQVLENVVAKIKNNLNLNNKSLLEKAEGLKLIRDTEGPLASAIAKTPHLSIDKVWSAFNGAEIKKSFNDLFFEMQFYQLVASKHDVLKEIFLHDSSVPSYLIIMIQRIMRYPMGLAQTIKDVQKANAPEGLVTNLQSLNKDFENNADYCNNVIFKYAELSVIFHKARLKPEFFEKLMKERENAGFGHNDLDIINFAIKEVKKTRKSIPLEVKMDLKKYIAYNKLELDPELKKRLESRTKKKVVKAQDFLHSLRGKLKSKKIKIKGKRLRRLKAIKKDMTDKLSDKFLSSYERARSISRGSRGESRSDSINSNSSNKAVFKYEGMYDEDFRDPSSSSPKSTKKTRH